MHPPVSGPGLRHLLATPLLLNEVEPGETAMLSDWSKMSIDVRFLVVEAGGDGMGLGGEMMWLAVAGALWLIPFFSVIGKLGMGQNRHPKRQYMSKKHTKIRNIVSFIYVKSKKRIHRPVHPGSIVVVPLYCASRCLCLCALP